MPATDQEELSRVLKLMIDEIGKLTNEVRRLRGSVEKVAVEMKASSESSD